MGSDWDFINDHMGGHDGDGLPRFMNNPCFNDDWEHELRNNGYKTVQEWNELGRRVKKDEKGKYLPCAKVKVFKESQTLESKLTDKSSMKQTNKNCFQSFEEAIAWARNNPGRAIVRSPTGNGYIEK